MKATVHVRLKPEVLDPRGKAIGTALGRIGFDEVGEVRQGKVFDIILKGGRDGAEARLRDMCERLLANTVIEDYRITIRDE